MPRDWTKQKRSTLCHDALDNSKTPYAPLHRATMSAAEVRKHTPVRWKEP